MAFANLTEEPGVTLEGTGFTGREVRESFTLAARRYPIDLVVYDNQRDDARALANAEDAIARKVDLYILYHRDPATTMPPSSEKPQARRHPGHRAQPRRGRGAALHDRQRGCRPDSRGCARRLRRAQLARAEQDRRWCWGRSGAQAEGIPERVQGVTEGLKRQLPSTRMVMLDTQGNPAQVGALLGKLLSAQPTAKILIAAIDDQTALAAKAALESAGRLQDGAIVSHGVDRSIHGGINEKKELDPNNRGSIVIGSVAFYLDRAGDDVLPLALGMLQGQTLPPRTAVAHRLVTATNVFTEYPPYDMN